MDSQLRRPSSTALAVFVFVSLITPILAVAQEPLRVYVFTAQPKGGVVDEDTKQRVKATSILATHLGNRKKTITIVDSKKEADVVVQVITNRAVTGDQQLGPDLLSGRMTITKTTEFITIVKVSFGHVTRTISRQSVTDAVSTRLVADDVEKWIKENNERVLESRKKQL